MPIDVRYLEWDEDDEEHLARHGVSASEVAQLLTNENVIASNPHGMAGTIRLIGHTNGGRLLTVVLEPTRDQTTWRPVTAWPTTKAEETASERTTR